MSLYEIIQAVTREFQSVRCVTVPAPEGRLRPGACFSTRHPDTARGKVVEFTKRWSDVSATVHDHLWSIIGFEKKALNKQHNYLLPTIRE